MKSDNQAKAVVGVDISKAKLDYFQWFDQIGGKIVNDLQSCRRFAKELRKRNVSLVCLEATGGYENVLVACLHQEGVPVAVVNPRRLRNFAHAKELLAKTDEIDARGLAEFGALIEPRITPAPSENAKKLLAATTRREQVLEMVVQEKNRRATVADTLARKLIDAHLKLLNKQIAELDKEITRLIEVDPQFAKLAKLLHSAPGVGAVTAAAILAELPELGKLNRQEIAKLTGIAPINHDSGKFKGKRFIAGGRGTLRKKLYMAAVVATRHNPLIATFYQRLVKNGKPKKLAIVACMRKLLCILNAMVKNQTPWKTTST